MSLHYLTLPELLLLQELAVERFGGIRGITEVGFGKLEAALAAPAHSMLGTELYPDLPSKASILFYSLVRGHCFSDGNKRTALLALVEFLARNGARLATMDDDTLFDFVIAAADRLRREEVEAWLSTRIVPASADS